VTTGVPKVRVPVLSKTTARARPICSSAAPPLTMIPARAARLMLPLSRRSPRCLARQRLAGQRRLVNIRSRGEERPVNGHEVARPQHQDVADAHRRHVNLDQLIAHFAPGTARGACQ